MDLYTINLKKFHIHYFTYILLGVVLGFHIVAEFVASGFRFFFYLGVMISFLIQFSSMELRFLPRSVRSLGESGFPFFTVVLFYFINLGVLTALVFMEYPNESIFGFLIAYFLHLLFFVNASYFSGK